jgi:hypothetical protein
METLTFIEVGADRFQEFILDALPKHHTSPSLLDELSFHRFHGLDAFKKDFINEILNNYYGMHYVGLVNNKYRDLDFKYKLAVTDKKLCTFFLLKYAN